MNIIHLDTVDSTNTYLKKRANDLPDRTVVIARSQTSGRGTRERGFISPEGGLYMSVLLKNVKPDLLTVCAGVSVADVISEYGGNPKIKWVNDVLIDGKKVCGILTEATNGNYIVGIGVNIKHNANLPETATTLGFEIAPKKILERFFYYFDNDVMDKYRTYSCVLGQRITFGEREGIASAILDNGNLEVKLDNGEIVILNSGEVSIKF
ncbi:MAG: biotin--[acetyl-CoA-carboxylase] ligase [Oscillospiraceae bacterium]|nr:biotin--[acetyl-CoA-carboxylase] ligase [Oscillospiraceae bacterium]